MKTIIAFLAAAAIVRLNKVDDPIGPPAPPDTTVRWWHSLNRLDGRVVAWSIRNNPKDWAFANDMKTRLRHNPSGHQFKVGGIVRPFTMISNRCGCSDTSKKFQAFHSWELARAVRGFQIREAAGERERLVEIRKDFASHFVK